MILAESMVDLLTDWHHWGFEIVAALAEFVVIGLIGTPLFRRWLKHHDKKHAHQHCEDVHQEQLFD